jgi:signal transduction histidine kinase
MALPVLRLQDRRGIADSSPMTESWAAPLVGAVEVGPTLRVVRALTAACGVAGFTALAVSWDLRLAWVGVGLAVVTLGDALLFRWKPGRSPVFRLMLDATVLVSVVIWVGGPALVAAPYAYLLAAALTVLPMRRALLVICYLTALVVAAQFARLPSSASQLSVPLTLLGILIPLMAMAAVLWVAGSAVRGRERRQQAAAEEARRADSAKSELLAAISHDIRGSLCAVSGFLSTLTDRWRDLDPAEVDEFLAIVATEAKDVVNLAEGILTAARLETGRLRMKPEVVALGPLIHGLVRAQFGTDAVAHVTVAVDPGARVWADRLHLSQVLRNLCSNAHRYGGDTVRISAGPQDGHLLLEVADDGPGIPAEDRDTIFEPFKGLHNQPTGLTPGTGLGLSIARGLARAMGGDLWCEPAVPKGARFCLTLPLPPSPIPHPAHTSARAETEEAAPVTAPGQGTGFDAPSRSDGVTVLAGGPQGLGLF